MSPAASDSRGAPAARRVRAKIAVEGLNVYYGSFRALRDVSLEVPEGRVTAVIGPSGCGKSTFLRTINRLHDLIPSARVTGRVTMDGENVLAGAVDVVELRRRVGMLFQQPNPFPMSIYDNVAYGLRLRGERRREELDRAVEESLRAAALWDEVKDRLHRPALRLSGGQQQRLCLARALAVRPEVLLMDEATSALDPAAAQRIEDLVARLRGSYTVVAVTHNLAQAARISDYTAFFLHGELVECAPTDEMFTRPSDRRTEDYITGRFG